MVGVAVVEGVFEAFVVVLGTVVRQSRFNWWRAVLEANECLVALNNSCHKVVYLRKPSNIHFIMVVSNTQNQNVRLKDGVVVD